MRRRAPCATPRCSPIRSSQSRVRHHTLADLCDNLFACCLRALSWKAQQNTTAACPSLFATQDWWLAAEAHFVWGSVMYGYLLYDTAFTLAFYSAVGSPSAPFAYSRCSSGSQETCHSLCWSVISLLHPGLGLASCALGLFGKRTALLPLPEQHVCCRV